MTQDFWGQFEVETPETQQQEYWGQFEQVSHNQQALENMNELSEFGLKNEHNIANYLCGKRFYQLNKHWRSIILKMFENVEDDDIIYCEKIMRNLKEDLMVVVHGQKRTISVKCGNIVTVHCEKIRSFCDYLIHLGFTEEQIQILFLYHYGDGTIDGTGTERVGVDVLKKRYREEIKEFNNLTHQRKILRLMLDRILSYGTINQKGHVDFLYYGTLEDGKIYNMQQFMDFLVARDYDKNESIHFGPFIYCPQNRTLKDPTKDPVDRHYTSLKWYGHQIDLDRYERYCLTFGLKP